MVTATNSLLRMKSVVDSVCLRLFDLVNYTCRWESGNDNFGSFCVVFVTV
jgi:hypothetical protein